MVAILFSIIVPALDDAQMILAALERLSGQEDEFEVIVVTPQSDPQKFPQLDDQAAIIACPNVTRGALLNAGAAAAKGEILLFLYPNVKLPDNALRKIQQNFQLLPQTIGGNFHLKFDENFLFTRRLSKLLKKWRYQGRYFANSGLFVRREVFQELGGFPEYDIFEDYEFAQALEKYGPTLYLPDYVTVATHKFRHRQLTAAFIWAITYMGYRFGISPDRLAKLHR